MRQPVCDCFFLNIEDAYRAAEARNTVIEANGRERRQYCYYDGPLTDITLPHFIQVSSERFVEFFSHNQLPIPEKIAISKDGGVQFGDVPADVVDEIRRYRATYKPAELVHFDTYFIDPLLALNVAKQRNRVACGHPTIDGLQICYYRGELPVHDLENLIHLELHEFEDFFVRSKLRMPEDIQIPDGLEADVQAAVRQDIADAIESIKHRRMALLQQLLNKAKAMRPGPIGERPRIFIPSNRLTTVMQYSSQGMAKAFAELGWEARFYIEASDMEGSNMVDMLEQYIDFDPHACFYVNCLNNSFMHPDVVNVIWWQDLMPQLKERQPLRWRERDFNFSISPLFDRYLADCAAERVERLHFVIDDEAFHNRIAGERAERVVFVGSSYRPAIDIGNARHQQALDALIEVMERGGTFDEATVSGIAGAAGLGYEFVFWKLLHYAVRDHALHWLCEADAGLPVDVYGRYWDGDERIAPYYRGELTHGEPVAEVYRNARYALVCHPFEINSQRLAEVAACGCIPVVYDCRDVAEPPHWDEYCLFFKTADELRVILSRRLRPAQEPDGLAGQFTYRVAVKRIIASTDLRQLTGNSAQGLASAAVLPELCGDRLQLNCDTQSALQTGLDRLQVNLAVLKQHRPELYDTLLAVWPAQRLVITTAQSIAGQYWRITVTSDGREVYRVDNIAWMEHRQIIVNNSATMVRESTCCYVLAGIGAGYELMAAYQATERPIPEMAEFEVPVYLVEPRPEMWLLNLLLHDLTSLLAAKRLQIYPGNNEVERLDVEFGRFEAALPDVLFKLDTGAEFGANAIYQRVIAAKQTRAERHTENLRQVAEYYAAISDDAWRDKFRAERRGELRVMGFISRFSSFLKYCMRDWLDGFERCGAQIYLCSEAENYYLSTIEHLIDEINHFKPDLILTIDHFRHEYEGIPESLPFVNWIQDMLPNITGNVVPMRAMDFTFVFSRDWLEMNGGDLYSSFPAGYLPLGYNDHYYRPEPVDGYDYDLLVASHLNDPALTFLAFKGLPPEQWLLDEHEQALIADGQFSRAGLINTYQCLMVYIDSLTADELHRLRIDGQTNGFAPVLEMLARHRIDTPESAVYQLLAGSHCRFHYHYLLTLKTAPIRTLLHAGLNLRIGLYGRNWEQFSQFAPFARGIADNGEFLNRLMRSSKICLNGSPGTSLHMRALEIMASGSFMLSRRIYKDGSPLEAYYDETEIAYYDSHEDLIDKVRYFLTNDHLRSEFAERAYRKTTALFSYLAIAEKVAGFIAGRLSAE